MKHNNNNNYIFTEIHKDNDVSESKYLKDLNNKREKLEFELSDLKNSYRVFFIARLFSYSLAALVLTSIVAKKTISLIISEIFFSIFSLKNFIIYSFIILFLVLFELFYKNNKRKDSLDSLKQSIAETDAEIQLTRVNDESPERKSEILFRVHQNELKRYYDINLSHYKSIYYTGLKIIFIGTVAIFGFLITGIIYNHDKFIMLIGTISGLLTNFIGAIFIKMYFETIKSTLEFHNKLVDSNNNLFANMLITKIEDKKIQNLTLAKIAKKISTANNHK